MSYPSPTKPPHRAWSYSVRYDYGGWRRRRRIFYTVDREGLLRLYRNVLRRCGRGDGWTEEVEAEVVAGSRTATFEVIGDDCKHFAEELKEMGQDETAFNVDAFAWAEEVAAAESRHEAKLANLTSV